MKKWIYLLPTGLAILAFSTESFGYFWKDNWKACDVFLDEIGVSGSETGGSITFKKHIWLSSGHKNTCALSWNNTCDYYVCTTNRSLNAGNVNYKPG
jgi:hypothetical protein